MSSHDSQEIEPIVITPETPFKFRCHPGVSCFNDCCAQTTIILSPYDVLRLKQHLHLTAADFLARYTVRVEDEFSGLPLVLLSMQGADRVCPFSSPTGCRVYEDRPATCRYYPVGVANQWTADGLEEIFVLIQEDHCLGFQADCTLTLEAWRQDQGLARYAALDREWKAIMLQIGARPGKPLSARFKEHYYQAAYDLDWFRSFIFDTDFFKIFDVAPEVQEQLRADEEELLRFACRYLNYMLRLGGTLQVKVPQGCPGQKCPAGGD